MDRFKSPVMWLTALAVGATTLIATWENMPEGVEAGLIVFLAMLGTFQTYAKVTRVAAPHDNAGNELVPSGSEQAFTPTVTDAFRDVSDDG